jgi:hypothetical protein
MQMLPNTCSFRSNVKKKNKEFNNWFRQDMLAYFALKKNKMMLKI